MPYTYEHEITVEKSPAYFRNVNPKLVYKANPSTKLILIIRNPVKRAISQFSHYIHMKKMSFDPNKYDNVSKFFDDQIFQNGQINRHWWISTGEYIIHFKSWLRYFPMKQFLFLNGENFIKSPYEEVKKVETFLNLKPMITKEHFFYNSKKGFYCIYKDLTKKRRRCMGSSKGRHHPFVSQVTVNKLYKYFYPYNFQLFKMLNQTPFWDI